jgi:hypothetical protein
LAAVLSCKLVNEGGETRRVTYLMVITEEFVVTKFGTLASEVWDKPAKSKVRAILPVHAMMEAI